MSKSDKNRPWEMRQDDPTLPGYVDHNHLEIIWGMVEGKCQKLGFELHSCDYNPRGNTLNFKNISDSNRCIRRVGYYTLEKTRKVGRKLARRSSRARLRQEMHGCKRDGVLAMSDIPIRQSRHNMYHS